MNEFENSQSEKMAKSGALLKRSPIIARSSSFAFIISVVGLAVQGLAGLVMYGPALARGSDGIPNDVSTWLSANIAPVTPSALWSLVLAFTIGAFVVGLVGVFWLRPTKTTKTRLGATLVLVSALVAATTAWGYGIGSLLMITGSIIGFKIHS